ncbi:MAG: c-type cytochrome [Planctomycetes bacterium]|nr:c-type cytochrome [Planctomycetota bacterium]
MYAIEGAAKGQIDPAIALDGENTLQRKIRSSLKDADPRVLAHALRLAERHKVYFSDDEMISLAKHKDIGVRYQLLWFLSGSDLDAGEVLTNLVKQDHADAWMRLAIICAATSKSAGLDRLDFIAEPDLRKTADGRAFIETLVETAGATPNRYVGTAAMRGISRLREDDVGFQFQLLGALVRRASEQNLALLRKNDAKGLFMQLRERAMETAQDSKASEADRVSAIRALAIQSYEELQPIFTISLKPTQPRAVQIAALELLSRVGPIEAPDLLLKIWPSLSPAVRATATEVFLSRANWLQAFLEAVEKGKIARADIDPARVGLLMKSPNRSVRVQVEELFGKVVTKRKDVVDYYQPSLTLKGDPLKGKAIFKKECAACHKLEGVGEEIGADLKAIRDRGTENMLLNILDPNREVKPQFLAYSLETTAGKTLSGMLTAETPNSVTIRLLDGRSEIVPRAEIDSLRSTGLSFMPEGLEKQIDKQAMADLLAYLNSIK